MRKLTHTIRSLYSLDLSNRVRLKLFTTIALLAFCFGNFSTLLAQCSPTSNAISGRIFLDNNYNGILDAEDSNLDGVKISAYDQNGNEVSSTISNSTSGYVLPNLVNGLTYRLEIDYSSGHHPALSSNGLGSDVKFITAPACDIPFGLQDPSAYCEETPGMLVTCYVRGNPTENLTLETVVNVPYAFTNKSTGQIKPVLTKAETGSVAGIVWRQGTQDLFTSAFVKQYASLKDNKHGAIYRTHFDKFGKKTTTQFVDLAAEGIDIGTLAITDSQDCSYGRQSGKIGLGGLEISDDEKTLYVTNLNKSTLVEIPISNPTSAFIKEYAVPSPNCVGGEFRLFALQQHNGLIYVGGTCTANVSKNSKDSEAVVYTFDPSTKKFKQIYRTNYLKGYWKDVMTPHLDTAQWLTDIAFTDKGHMALSMGDRIGHLYCNTGSGRLDQQYPDMLLLWNDKGTWKLENNGMIPYTDQSGNVIGTITGSGVGNGQGPGGGEFFGEDAWPMNPVLHPEILLGNSFVLPGRNEIIATAYDPDREAYSAGLIRYSTDTGEKLDSILLYIRNSNPYLGKATGFGDLVLKCGAVPIEIGDYVWIDANGNGIQDPNEASIGGLTINLYDEFCNKIGETVTDNMGHYLFGNHNVDTNLDGTYDGLTPESCYYIVVQDSRFETRAGNLTIGASDPLTLTRINYGSNDDIDNDASIAFDICDKFNGYPVIKMTTGPSGNNDYSLDFGFTTKKIFDLALRKVVRDDVLVQIGDNVIFDITIFNQGNVIGSKIQIVDYLSSGYNYVPGANKNWSEHKEKIVIHNVPGVLRPGESYNVSIEMSVDRDATFENLINWAEIYSFLDGDGNEVTDIDSTPDDDQYNDVGGIPDAPSSDNEIFDDGTFDEDDQDPARVRFIDLALKKEVDGDEISFVTGSEVDFKITIYNQSNEAAHLIQITDYIPEGMSFVVHPDYNWTKSGESTYMYEIPGQLAGNDLIEIFIRLKIDNDFAGDQLINMAEISFMEAVADDSVKDFDSTPNSIMDDDKGGNVDDATDNEIFDRGLVDEDDHDPARVMIRKYDIGIDKTTNVNQVQVGDIVQYDLRVYNDGNATVNNIRVVDILNDAFTLADPTWNVDPSDPSGNTVFKILSVQNGLLPVLGLLPQEEVTVHISVRISPLATFGNLRNCALIGNYTDTQGNPVSSSDGNIDNNKDIVDISLFSLSYTTRNRCLENATLSMPGEFEDVIEITGPCGAEWEILTNVGFYASTGVLHAIEFELISTPLGGTPGYCTYELTGLHLDGEGYVIRFKNDNNDILRVASPGADYDQIEITGDKFVCISTSVLYQVVNPVDGVTYTWSLPDGGGSFIVGPEGTMVEVLWEESGVFNIAVSASRGCIAPSICPVNVGIAAGTLACIGSFNASVNDECEFTVLPEMLLASTPAAGSALEVILIDPHGDMLPSNDITSDYFGQTIIGKLVDPCTGNSCWTTIIIEDKEAPIIECGEDVTVSCLRLGSYLPEVADNCDGVIDIIMTNEEIIKQSCDADYVKIIERAYIAKDQFGNVSQQCDLTIKVLRPDLDLIVWPKDFLASDGRSIICKSDYPVDDEGHPDPVLATGVPTLDGIPLYLLQDFTCKLYTTYQDVAVNKNGCITSINRTWTVYEQCSGFDEIKRYLQVIQISDPIAPSVTCPHDMTVTTNGYTCEADVNIPIPVASDNCSDISHYELLVGDLFVPDFKGGKISLEMGMHTIELRAFDQCDNYNICTYTVFVEDNTGPTVVCDQYTKVGLTSDGEKVSVPATVFDDGSTDDCGIHQMLVRRMNPSCDCQLGHPEFSDMYYLGTYGDKYYYLSKDNYTADIAFKQAKAKGGYAVKLETKAEDQWVFGKVQSLVDNTQYWIGLADANHEDHFEWQDGSLLLDSDYQNWQGSMPNDLNGGQDYVKVPYWDGGKWYDTERENLHPYVLEVSDPCGFSDHTYFCCEDVGNDEMVIFRAIDYSGNYNDCMVSVDVQDKTPPVILCPPNLTIACEFDWIDISIFGSVVEDIESREAITISGDYLIDSDGGLWDGYAHDNCDVQVMLDGMTDGRDNCGQGQIVRSWKAFTPGTTDTVRCHQYITFRTTEDFMLKAISWPRDTTLNTCMDIGLDTETILDPDIYGRPVFEEDGECNLVGMSFEDETYYLNNTSGDACFKVIREWKVINWCDLYDDDGNVRERRNRQIFKFNNKVAPVIENLVDIDTCSYDIDCEVGTVILKANASDDCTLSGNLRWEYRIDYDKDGVYEVIKVGNGDMIDASGVHPLGDHSILYIFEDLCGNKSFKGQNFRIRNCKDPVASCIQGFVVGIEPMDLNGDNIPDREQACIWASELNASSYHNCGYPLWFSFSADTTDTKLTLDCLNLGPVVVEFWVTDINGNTDICTTTIIVQDNNDVDLCDEFEECVNWPEAEITVSNVCNEDFSPTVILSNTTVNPDCACNNYTITYTDTEGTNPTTGCRQIMRKWKVVFDCGILDELTYDQVINVLNTQAITLTCPSGITVNAATGCTAFVTIPAPTAMGACNTGVTITHNSVFADNQGSDASGTYPVGVTTVTFTAMDFCGNTGTCSVDITVRDNSAPICVLKDISVSLDNTGVATITGVQLDNGSTDACGGALTYSVNPSMFDCTDVGDNVATVTVSDQGGNSTTCTATVTITENLAPICMAKDITVSLTADGTVTIQAADIDDGSQDNCSGGAVTLGISQSTFDCSHVSAAVAVTLTVTDSDGNSTTCVGNVTVVDDLSPVCNVKDISVSLTNDGTVTIAGTQLDDGSTNPCGGALTFDVVPSMFDCTDVGVNDVVVTVTNANGNTSTCTAQVTVNESLQPICSAKDITINLDTNGNATIVAADIDNGSQEACGGGAVTLAIDKTTFTCADAGDVIVTLTVTDTDGDSSTCTSTVTVMENTPPICVAQDVTVFLDEQGNVTVPASDVDNGSSDACGMITDLTLNPSVFDCTDIGDNVVILTVTDESSNSSTCTANVTVRDTIAPICLVKDITIALDINGEATVNPDEVNNGSSDVCSDVSLIITPGQFFCNDIGTRTFILTVTDQSGNSSTCIGNVTITDIIPPRITCPADMSIECEDPIDDLSIYGIATVVEECAEMAVTETVERNINACNIGVIKRTFTVSDNSGNVASCEQIITISGPDNPITGAEVSLPSGTDTIRVTSCTTLDPTTIGGMPIVDVSMADCVVLGFSYADVNNTPNGGCPDTLTRTWTVVDSCQLNGDGMTGMFVLNQILLVSDTDPPVLNLPSNLTINLDSGACDSTLTLIATATDCDPNVSITNNSTFAADPNSGDASGDYTEGVHVVTFIATDFCGNSASGQVTITVNASGEDSYSCVKKVFEITDNRTAVVHIDSVTLITNNNCTGTPTISAAFSRNNVNDSLAVFDCNQVDDIDTEMWFYRNGVVIDSCRILITIQDPQGFCNTITPDPTVFGIISTETGTGVSAVNVELINSDLSTYQTKEDGYFAFPNMPLNGNYIVHPTKDVDHANGVTTLDLILIQNHILEVSSLQSPYKLIAADINNSGDITVNDLVDLRKLVLGVYDKFPSNTSWKMVDKSHSFLDESNPFIEGIPEEFYINSLTQDMETDFVGVKIGDVNDSADPSGFVQSEVRGHNTPLQLVANQVVSKEGTSMIEVTADNYNDIRGFQFTMQFPVDRAKVKDVLPGVLPLNASNLGSKFVDRGLLTMSYNEIGIDRSVSKDDVLFTIVFDKETSNVKLEINSKITSAEAYTDTVIPVSIRNSSTVDENVELYQNKPNPWSSSTNIEFYLPIDTDIELIIYDVTGRKIKSIQGEYKRGLNSIQINKKDLTGVGFMYYELKTPRQRLMKKMLLLN